MTPAIQRLLTKAAWQSATQPVPTDTAMQLAAEGYDLDALDGDCERIREEATRG